jgi:PAS domain S-box-containing protein
MFGYHPGELLGQHVTVQNAYPPEENARRVAEVMSVLATEGFWEGEWLNRRKDGSAFVTASRINAVVLNGRRHWICVQRDVSEARHAEDMRRKSEARLRLAVDAARIAIWEFDSASDSIQGSPELYQLLGLPTDRPVSSDEIRAGYLPGERERIRADAEAAIRRGERHIQNELRYRGADGEVRTFLLRADLQFAGDGVLIGALGVLIDITEYRRTEEALRQSEERLALAVRAHGIGIFDWHIQSGQVIWTDQEERLFGLQPGEFEGDLSGWEKRVLPEDRAQMLEAIQAATASREQDLDFQFRIRRSDGAIRFVEGSGKFLYGDDGTPERMVGVNIDVTDRARADEHQLILIRELNHRVKNTLAIVQGLARQSLGGAVDPVEANKAFNDRLQALASAHDVLTQVNWDKAELREIARTIIRPYQGVRTSRFLLDGPSVQLRPQSALSLAMVLHELCTNAVKYGALSTEKGQVEIAWRVGEEAGASVLQFSWRERNGPDVVTPSRKGFGSRLIERGWTSAAQTEVQMEYREDGLVCTMTARQARVEPEEAEQVW